MIIGNWELKRKKQNVAPPTAPAEDKHALQFKGWPPSPTPLPLLDMLSDEQLDEINHLLDFNCFTVDGRGRRFGLPAGPKKRRKPQEIPDRRITQLDEMVGLKGKRVLEVGCFEGVHTIALAQRARSVLALDSRVENVVKTIVRTAFYDLHPRIMAYDLEKLSSPIPEWLDVDVLFHVGVLYHLSDPVRHLKLMLEGVSQAILLDTHVARESQLNAEYLSDGRTWRYYKYGEKGYGAVFAGMKDHAKWILEEDLNTVLKEAGFSNIQKLEERDEKNGKRIYLIAQRISQ